MASLVLIKRSRSTKAEVEARREALLDIIEAGRPMTVRQMFCHATVEHLPAEQFEVLKAAEQSERDIIMRLVGGKIARERSRR